MFMNMPAFFMPNIFHHNHQKLNQKMNDTITPELKEKFYLLIGAYDFNKAIIDGKDQYAVYCELMHAAYTLCSEKDKWISVETPPEKTLADKNGEIYVIAADIDSDGLIVFVEKAFYKPSDNTYWVPFMGEQTYPTHYMPLPNPPQAK